MTAYAECLGCKPLTVCNLTLTALLLQKLQERLVLCLGRDDDYVSEILGSSTYKADAAYVYLLDDV